MRYSDYFKIALGPVYKFSRFLGIIVCCVLFINADIVFANETGNNPPVANAGDDITTYKDSPLSGAVFLDGSASNDPDGDVLSYTWYGPFQTISDEIQQANVPEGSYTISLVVNDGQTQSVVDTMIVTVEPCFEITGTKVSSSYDSCMLRWPAVAGTERYDIFRSTTDGAVNFIKVGELIPSGIEEEEYIDYSISGGQDALLYLIGSLQEGEWCYSKVRHILTSFSRGGADVDIYSTPVSNATVGIVYNYHVHQAGGNPTWTRFSLISGPPDMQINTNTGLISWVPTQPGSFEVTVKAKYSFLIFQDSDTQSFTIEVSDSSGGENQQPVAISDSHTINEDSAPTTIVVLANDTDPDGDSLSLISYTQPVNGTVIDNGDNTLTYTPNPNFNGTDTFEYTISDGNSGTGTGTVTVIVNPMPDPPVATDDTHTTNEDTPTTPILVLANDTDPDGDTLSISSFTNTPYGTIVDNGDNTLTYTPNPNFNGTDQFQYAISDGNSGSSSATVWVTVIPVNDPPIAVDDAYMTNEDNASSLMILSNDTDADGDILTLSSFTQPLNGMVSDRGDNTLLYTPNTNWHGTDTFEYTVSDGNSGTGSATVTITVNAMNDAPVAVDDSLSTDEDTISATIAVLTNDTDPDGDLLSLVSFTQPANGTATDNGGGTLRYTPNSDFYGTDTFEYTISDGNSGTGMGVVTVTVNPMPDPPVAVADTHATIEDSASTLIVVLANDTDPDGDLLSLVSFTQPANGTVTDNGDGTLTYTPNPNFNGTDTFEYTISDGNAGTSSAIVTITVYALNDAPAAVNDFVSTDEDTASTPIAVMENDIDEDGDTLFLVSFIQPTNGTVTDNGDGTLTYTPNPNFNGTDTFEYTISDGNAGTSSATVTITVASINDLPTASAGPDQNVYRDETVQLDGSGSTDIDGDVLSYLWAIISAPTGSTANLSASSQANPTLTPDLAGAYEIQLDVTDGNGGSSSDTIIINATVHMVEVPAVTGLTQGEAEVQINSANLTLGSITSEYNSSFAAGQVISQNPEAGTTVEVYSPLSLIISLGPSAPPIVTMTPKTLTVEQGTPVTLSWTSTGSDAAYIDNGIGSVATSGTVTITPETSTVYLLTVSGPGGSSNAMAHVSVTVPIEPQPEGTFGQQYEDLIPADSSHQEYAHHRFSVITGHVQDINQSPLENVTVGILNQPDYGTVHTDQNGFFSIPVEGGGYLTLAFGMDGYISSQRRVYVDWNDFAVNDPVILLTEDTASTQIMFDGNPETIMTHKSTTILDGDGTRSCSMVFSGDTNAYLVDEDGNDIYQLETIVTRATEFTTPSSMPAELPDNTAFTYCVELKADGADNVRFDKPVITWVDNFLGFDVGMIVPSGYYDRNKGIWVPQPNGVVVRLLDLDSDGIVDALDSDNDGQPNDMNEDGYYGDEVAGLDNATVYVPGSTFWRVPVSHFSVWDFNWPSTADSDARAPNPNLSPYLGPTSNGGIDCSNQYINSYVKEKSRIFHEDIPIPGTDITLHYSSERASGFYSANLIVPVSGDEQLPQGLKRIIATFEVAGLKFTQTAPALPNQFVEFHWDGQDVFGNFSDQIRQGLLSIGYVYNSYYVSPANASQAFSLTGGDVTIIPGRSTEVILWSREIVLLRKGAGTLADGWTISNHHHVNPSDPSILYKGDGSKNDNQINIIDTIIPAGYTGNYTPISLSFDKEGNLYVAEDDTIPYISYSRIIKMTPDYQFEWYGLPPSGSTNRIFDGIGNITIDENGVIYLSVLRYYDDRPAQIARINQNGEVSYIYDVPGTEYLNRPLYVFSGKNGNLYFIFYYDDITQKLDASGNVTSIGVPVTYIPKWVDGEDNIYFEINGNQVGRYDSKGKLEIIAGTGVSGYSGDGGLAVDCQLDGIRAIATDQKGNIFVLSQHTRVLRRIDNRGVITTIAGNPSSGSLVSGDGGPAAAATIYGENIIGIDPEGALYIINDGAIRKISIPSGFKNKADLGDIIFTEESGLYHVMSHSGIHLRTVDLNTDITLRSFDYDQENKLIGIVDQFGNRITIERDANGTVSAIISPDGLRTEITIDSDHQIEQIIYPDETYYEFEYAQGGLMTAEIDPNGNRFEHEFDQNGLLNRVGDPELGEWTYSRQVLPEGYVETTVTTAENNQTVYRDSILATDAATYTTIGPNGEETTYAESFDGLNLTKQTACGMAVDYAYDIDKQYHFKYPRRITQSSPNGLVHLTQQEITYTDSDADGEIDQITKLTTINGNVFALNKDKLSHTIQTTTPEGRVIENEYDPSNLLITRTSIPGFDNKIMQYDNRGRLESLQQGTRGVSIHYNTAGLPETITMTGQQPYSYGYDTQGRVTSVTRPDNSEVGYGYDDNGNLSLITTPSLISHQFFYNGVNNKDSYQTPISGNYSYYYNRDRQLTGISFPSGRQISNIYDHTNIAQIQMPHATVDLTYLCGSRVDTMTMSSETIGYDYDGKLVTSVSTGGTLNQSIEYSYNNDFKTTLLTYAGQSEVLDYDSDGLLTTKGNYAIDRNTQNGLPEAVRDGQVNIGLAYNTFGEIESQTTTVTSSPLIDWAVTRDSAGRIVTKTETADGITNNYIYGYDDFGRMLTVTLNGTLVEDYTYGAAGSRSTETNTLRGITGRAFVYSDEDHLLTADDVVYSYDLDGFLSAKTESGQVTTYDYSIRGELLSVSLPDGRIIDYLRDPLGRRIAKLVDGSIVEKYFWAGMTTLLAVYDGSDNLIQRFEYANSRVPVAMTQAGHKYYLGYDQVGSLRIVADTTGAIIKRIDYDSFGNILNDTNPSFSIPFGFAGGVHDRDIGLVRFGFRDYDPDMGRWTSKDPIQFSGGDTDLFGYVQNNPVNRIDPLGLLDIFFGVEGDLVGIVGLEGGFGIVIDTDNLSDSGIYGTIGPAVGANVGIGVGGGVVKEIEGWSYGLDVNVGPASGTIIGDNSGFNGIGVSVGPGIGLSGSATYTGTYTFGKLWDWINGKEDPCK